ncbi:hypothetical protein [Roseibium sp. SCP14]|uniref:hypothetical protein n=1 Tax=Roseibium sp. SCP14 TaxID=3141375 RepID=UPI00333CAF58
MEPGSDGRSARIGARIFLNRELYREAPDLNQKTDPNVVGPWSGLRAWRAPERA